MMGTIWDELSYGNTLPSALDLARLFAGEEAVFAGYFGTAG
jgi:hypothetical protein